VTSFFPCVHVVFGVFSWFPIVGIRDEVGDETRSEPISSGSKNFARVRSDTLLGIAVQDTVVRVPRR